MGDCSGGPAMLIPRRTLDAIADGRVTLAFRRWTRPTVKAGGRLRTAVGELDIEAVDRVALSAITAADARAAGFATKKELASFLNRKERGDVYRVKLSYGGPDRRLALREAAELSADDVARLKAKLDSLDRRAQRAPWTRQVLGLIERKPATLAEDLAAELGRPKLPFKADVRKLKELGLTISLERGYRLSPRGEAFLAADRAAAPRD